MENLLDGLNDKQREAVEYTNGPILVLAGAGSGKTRVLTYKIAHLIEKKIVKPWEILSITFTNKAAKEMKERVQKLLVDESKDIWLGTFHSVCIRILKREIENLGYSKNFNVYDEDDKLKVIKEIMKEENIDDKELSAKYIISEISSAKDKFIDPEEYMNINETDYMKKRIGKVYDKYQKRLKKNDGVDFDDIINLTVRLFIGFPERLAYYQNKFKYILVDEYQDTNRSQFMLISLLAAHGNICVVGDESQSIYGFRGADISNILNFEKEFEGAKIVKLEENYRSTQNILNAANQVIKNNKSRLDKKLWTQNNEGEKIGYYVAKQEYDEAEFVINTILELKKKNDFKLNDFAVLYRMNTQSRVIEEKLLQEGIAYRLIGGFKFYGRKEVKDVMAYLKLVQNQHDDVSFKRTINEPKRGIGDTTVDNLQAIANEQNISIFELIQDDNNLVGMRSAESIKKYRDILNTAIEMNKEGKKASEIMMKIVENTGYIKALESDKSKENESKIENVYELMGVAKEYDNENADSTLENFLDTVALVSDVDKLDDESDAVTLMTLHSAKGLEFKIVFLIGMEEGIFPSFRAMNEDKDIEEERRICYVGITRAMKRLFITNAKQRTIFGSTSYTIPSRFVQEIPKELYEEQENEQSNFSNNMVSRGSGYGSTSKGQYLNSEYDRCNKMNSNNVTVTKVNVDTIKQTNKTSFGVSAENFLKGMISSAPKATDVNLDDYTVGKIVNHKKFGKGIIIKSEPENDDLKLEIQFDRFGMKRLMAKFAGLEIVM